MYVDLESIEDKLLAISVADVVASLHSKAVAVVHKASHRNIQWSRTCRDIIKI